MSACRARKDGGRGGLRPRGVWARAITAGAVAGGVHAGTLAEGGVVLGNQPRVGAFDAQAVPVAVVVDPPVRTINRRETSIAGVIITGSVIITSAAASDTTAVAALAVRQKRQQRKDGNHQALQWTRITSIIPLDRARTVNLSTRAIGY